MDVAADLAHWAGIVLLLLFCGVSLATLIVGLPGTFLIFGVGLAYGALTGFAGVTWWTLAGVLGLAVVAEIIEFAAAARGTGGTEKPTLRIAIGAIVGAIGGGILFAPVLLGLGALFGAFGGAFGGAALAAASEGHDRGRALAHGFSALRGRVLGFVVKSAVAIVMIVWLTAAAI
jgi:hypothetical protein